MYNVNKIWSFVKNPLKGVKSSWQKLNPYEKWQALYKFLRFFCQLMQFELLTKRPNGPVAYSIGVVCFCSFGLFFYTTWYYMHIEAFTEVIPVYCIFGLMIAVSTEFLLKIYIEQLHERNHVTSGISKYYNCIHIESSTNA